MRSLFVLILLSFEGVIVGYGLLFTKLPYLLIDFYILDVTLFTISLAILLILFIGLSFNYSFTNEPEDELSAFLILIF